MTDETSDQEFADINDALADFGAGDGPDHPVQGAVPDQEGFDQEQIDAIEEAQRAMADARERLADVPAEVVVTNHVMGLYELAAIHLSATPPDLEQASLGIDSVACLVEGLGDRLGADAPVMRDALANIRMAFVQIKGADETGAGAEPA